MNIITTKWLKRHFEIAYLISKWSKDPSTKVGSVIITKEGKPKSWGFNGIPSGVEDYPARFERPIKYNFFAHAERNAIDLCDTSVKDCILICTHSPCSDCARGIVSHGIDRVVVDVDNGFMENSFITRNETSLRCHHASLEMFTESGVEYNEFNLKTGELYNLTKTHKGDIDVYKIPN